MATSADYANWLRNNQNKRGTPNYATVLRAYQEAALEESQAAQAPAPAAPAAKPESGFFPALRSGATELGGGISALLGRLGLKDEATAQAEFDAAQKRSREIFAPTEEWGLTKGLELLGGSIPYMAAPLVAGAAATTLPLTGPAALVTTLGAAGLTSAAQFTATNLSRQMEEGKKLADTDLGNAALAAVPMALLDTAAMRLIPGIGRIFGQAGIKVTPETAKEIAEQALKKTLIDYTAATGKTMGVEGLTEAMQQVLERAQAGLSLTDPKAQKEYFDSFIGGAVLGGTLAVPGRYLERSDAQGKARELLGAQEAEKRKAEREAEEAKKKSPEYLLDLEARYKAAVAKKAELDAAAAKKPPTGADPAAMIAYRDAVRERDAFAKKEMAEVSREYVTREKEIAALKEQQRVAGMTPLEYQMEQAGVDLKTPVEQRVFTGEETFAPREKVAPAPEYAASRIALANEQRYAEGMDPKDRAGVYAEYLMGSVPTARQLVAANEPIPGVSASVSRSVLAQLKLRLKAYDAAQAAKRQGSPIAQLEAEEAAALEDTARAEEARLAETEERKRLAPEITALQRMAARRLPDEKAILAGIRTALQNPNLTKEQRETLIGAEGRVSEAMARIEARQEDPYLQTVIERAARAAPAPAPQPSAAIGQMQQLLTGQDVTYTAEEPKERQLRRVPGEGFKLFGESAGGRKELLNILRRYTDVRQEEQELRAALPEKPVLGRSTEEEIAAYEQAVADFDDFVKNELRPVEAAYQRRKSEIDALRAAEAAPAKTPDTKLLRERINRALLNPDLSDAAYDLLRRAENLLPDVEMRLETLRTVQDPTRGTQQDIAQTAGLLELLDKQLTQIEIGTAQPRKRPKGMSDEAYAAYAYAGAERRREGLPMAGRTLEQQRRPIAPGAANIVEPTLGTQDDIKLARQRSYAELVSQGFSPGEAAKRAFQIGKPTREAQEVPTDRFATPVLPPERGSQTDVTRRFAAPVTPMQPREARQMAPGPEAERQPGRFLAQPPRKGTIRAQGAPLSLASEIEPLLDALERARAEDAGQQVLFPELEKERGTIASTPEAFRRRLERLKAVKDGYARELLRKEAAIEPLEQEIAQLEETLVVYQQQQKAFENAQFILNNNAALLKELRMTGAGTDALRGGMGALTLSEKNLKQVADAFARQRTLINAYLERVEREKAEAPKLKASDFNEIGQLLATQANDEARAKQALEFVQEELTRITRAEEDIYNRQFPQLDQAKETARAGMRDLHKRYGEASEWLNGLKELRVKIQRQQTVASESQKQRTSNPELSQLVADLGRQLEAIDGRIARNKALMGRLETQIAVAVAESKIATLKANASPEAIKRASDDLVAAKQRLRTLRAEVFKGQAKEVEAAAEPQADEATDYAENLKTHQRMLEAMQLRTESGTIVPALSYAQRLAREAGTAANVKTKFSVDDLALLDKDPKRVLNGLVSRATDLENKIRQAVARSRGAEFRSEKDLINRYSNLLYEYENAETALERSQLEPELSIALREYNDALNKTLNQRVVWKGQARDTAELLNTYQKIAYLEERFFLPQAAEKRTYGPETPEEIAAREREAAAIFESQREAQAGAGETTGEALTRSQAAKRRKPQKTVYSGKGVGPEELSKKDAEDLLVAEGKQANGQPLTARERKLLSQQRKADERIAENTRIKEEAAKNALVRAAFEKKERKEQLTALEQFLYDEAVSAGAKTAEDVDAISLEEAAATETKPSRGARTTEEAVDEKTRTELEETFAARAGFEDVELSRGATANPSTTDSVRTELKPHFPDLGRVQVYDSVEALVKANPQYEGRIPDDARGFVDRAGNKAFLIAGNINQGQALSVLLHEVGAHIGMKNLLGDAQYNALVKAVQAWEKRNDASQESRVARAARARVEAAETPASQVNDELLAYAVEEAVNAGVKPMETKGALGQWLSQIATLFRKALEKFGMAPEKLDAQGLIDLAFGAAKIVMQPAVPQMSRRQFLRGAGAALGAMKLPPLSKNMQLDALEAAWNASMDAAYTWFDAAKATAKTSGLNKLIKEFDLDVDNESFATALYNASEDLYHHIHYYSYGNLSNASEVSYHDREYLKEHGVKAVAELQQALQAQRTAVLDAVKKYGEERGALPEVGELFFSKNLPTASRVASKVSELTPTAAEKQDTALQEQVSQFLMGGPRPAEPAVLYRGVPKGVSAVFDGKYIHVTPWASIAYRSGKGVLVSPKHTDVYEFPVNKNQKYYRAGALAGDPLETTEIHNAKGMTWDQALDAAKELYKEKLPDIDERYTQRYLSDPENLQNAKEAIAGEAAYSFTVAVFEADANNTPGVWVNKKVPAELDRDTPALRAADADEVLFSRKTTYSPGLAAAGKVSEQLVGGQKGFVDKLRDNSLGMGGRTQYIDKLFPTEEALKRGGVNDKDAMQAMYYLRMYDQRMHFTSQAMTVGVPERVEKTRRDGTKEFLIEAKDGANLKQAFDILKRKAVVKEAGSADAANKLVTLYMAAIRGERVGYDTLNFGRAWASAEIARIEGELKSPKLSAEQRTNLTKRKDRLSKRLDSMPSPADIKAAKAEIDANPVLREAFNEVRDIYNQYNRDLLNFNVQTGAISRELANKLLQESDYIPYYRVRDGVAELLIGKETPIRIGNLKDSPHLQELVGGDEPVMDFITSSIQNTSMLIDMATHNLAMRNLMFEFRDVGLATIGKTKGGKAPEGAVTFKVDGVEHYGVVDTEMLGISSDLLVKGLAGIPTMFPTMIRVMGMPARFLRRLIVASPVYMARQLFRDSLGASIASGANTIPLLSALKQIGKTDVLERRGITGGQVFTGMPEDMSRMIKDMQAGKISFNNGLAWLESKAAQADALTRRSQYESYLQQGLSEMEATYMALESMNFSRRGLSPSIHMASALIPFFNTQIQGLDVLYRSLRGKMPMNERLNVRRKLLVRGAMLFGLSFAYALAMQDDEAYKNAKPEDKYGNWFVPLDMFGIKEPLRLPIPFELGYIFKALPEAIVNIATNEKGAEEAQKALKHIGQQTVPGLSNFFIPQAVKPALEVAFGSSIYTGRDIEPAREQGVEPGYRTQSSTTELAKAVGEMTGFSPIKLEFLIRGYTGQMGMAAIAALSAPFAGAGEGPAPATKRYSDLPLIGTLFQPRDASGIVDLVYERMNKVRQAQETYERFVSEGKSEKAAQYAKEKADELSLASVAGAFRQQMGEITDYERRVRASNLSPERKREELDRAIQAKITLSKTVQAMSGRRTPQAAPA